MTALTTAGFKRKAEAVFLKANPDAKAPTFEWVRVSPPCPYADGSGKFRTGRVRVSAEGFRSTFLHASVDLTTGTTVVW